MYIHVLKNGIGLLGRLNPTAAGPRRPADGACPWGAAEGAVAQLRSLGEALGSGGGPACSDRLLTTQQAVGACCGAEVRVGNT